MKEKKRTLSRGILSFVLCLLLIAAAILSSGCKDTAKKGEKEAPASTPSTEAKTPLVTEETQSVSEGERKVIGEGQTVFFFTAVFQDGSKTEYEVHTDKEKVGDALIELGLISGENGQYGLYVKEVCGVTADYDKDGTYWAFYIDGTMAMSGIDVTDIKAGALYEMRVER